MLLSDSNPKSNKGLNFPSNRPPAKNMNMTIVGHWQQTSNPSLSPHPKTTLDSQIATDVKTKKSVLSNMIEECKVHEKQIKHGLGDFDVRVKKHRMKQQKFEQVSSFLTEVNIAHHSRLANMYQYKMNQSNEEMQEQRDITYQFKTAQIEPGGTLIQKWERIQAKKARNKLLNNKVI